MKNVSLCNLQWSAGRLSVHIQSQTSAQKDFAQDDLYDSGVYSREIVKCFSSVKCLGLSKT